ncbi:P-type conjugative transfer protein TrbL [Acidithiobacillus montserratensis]|uniref:P-type conjugative transfer protein TrbL n=1 Tax=Acidithiobacillus montserratensis TaxID=2729135 RepID=A0ACD5HJV3_9PROT|nr:P-type conjugative transfer protein TrbL [Acidithiobacillus montserratensis]MBU2747857.1 P-type conjugative transfer protein TrbL [Acidithiobacillus montserratensis]
MKKNWLAISVALLSVMMFPASAMAAGTGILNSVDTDLHNTIFGWAGAMQTATAALFFALAGVEVAIMFMQHVLQKRGHEDLFTGIIKKTITLGFFLWLINNAVGGIGFMPSIIDGLAGGAAAVGAPPATPSTIATESLDIGIGIIFSPMAVYGNHAATISQFDSDISSDNISGAVTTAFNNFSYSSGHGNDTSSILGVNFKAIMIMLMQTIMMIIPAIIAAGGVFMLALDFLMIQLESYLAMVLGLVVLAGGGLRYTSKYVGSYLDYGIGVGVRLFVISAISYLVVTFIFKDLTKTLQIQNVFQMAFETMMLAIIIAILPKKAVSIAQTILTGQSSFGGEGGKALAAGAGVAAVAATGGAALAAGGVAMAGGAVAKAAAAGSGGSLSGAAAGGGGGAGGASGSLSSAAGAGGSGAANGVPVPAGSLAKSASGSKPSAQTPNPEKPAASGPTQGAQKSGDGAPVPSNASAGGGEPGAASVAETAAPAETGAGLGDTAAALEGAALATEAASSGTAAAPAAPSGTSTAQKPAATQTTSSTPGQKSGETTPAGKAATGTAASPAGTATTAADGPVPATESSTAGASPGATTGGGQTSSGPAGSGNTSSSATAETGAGSSPASEPAGSEESSAPSDSGTDPEQEPAPAPTPVSDAHGVPAPALADLQKALDQIARNTAPKKSGNVITRTEDKIKKYQERVDAISEKPGSVSGKGISTEHPSDW